MKHLVTAIPFILNVNDGKKSETFDVDDKNKTGGAGYYVDDEEETFDGFDDDNRDNAVEKFSETNSNSISPSLQENDIYYFDEERVVGNMVEDNHALLDCNYNDQSNCHSTKTNETNLIAHNATITRRTNLIETSVLPQMQWTLKILEFVDSQINR